MKKFRIQVDTVEHYEEVFIVRAETVEEAIEIQREFAFAYDEKFPDDERVDYLGKTCVNIPYTEDWVSEVIE